MANKVYFAFHYEDVAELRANVVRKHNFTKGVGKRQATTITQFGRSRRKQAILPSSD